MQSNYFGSMNFGFDTNGQGIQNAVERTHRTTLRGLVTRFARRLSLRGSWRAIKRTLAGSMASHVHEISPLTLAPATCPAYLAGIRFQRDERWMSGVVVDPGTVGVC